MAKIIICADCGEEKKHKAFGLCGACHSRRWYQGHREESIARTRRWQEENREDRLAYMRRWREAHRQDIAAYNRRRYEENPERYVAYASQWREENPDKAAARIRCWQQKNPEKVAVLVARRKARKCNLPDTLTTEQAECLLAIGRAVYPGEKLALDHIVPLSKGGGTTRANMHAIPARLNISKKDKLPQEAYRQVALI